MNYFSIELFAKLSGFVHSLASEGLNLNSVYEKNSNDFEGHFEKGQRIIFSRDTDLSGAFENLKTILESKEFGGIKTFEQIDYIDLRFGNKIFYKSK